MKGVIKPILERMARIMCWCFHAIALPFACCRLTLASFSGDSQAAIQQRKGDTMKRMKQTWLDDPTGRSRVAVELTNAQKAEINDAMQREGIRSISDFLRFAALRLARS